MTEVTDNAAPSVFIQFPQLHTGTFELKYDSCGRLITDETRDITSISYDRNNNAKLINYNGGLIRATYRPDGVKMFQSTQEALSTSGISPAYIDTEDIDSKITPLANRPSKYKYTTRYWYGPVYIESDKYPRIYFDTGYAEIKGDSVQYYYFVKDYLGSIATITDKNGTILQTNRYLSGGLPQTAMTINDRFIDNHLYCSMQYTGTHSMGLYDNTARIYDAILTRFTTQDPLSEKYPDISPYASRANNPMKYVDEDGRKLTDRAKVLISRFLININTLSADDKKIINNEIEAITKSEQVYDIMYDKGLIQGDKVYGKSSYDLDSDMFVIEIPEYNTELIAHEAKHAYQFENGEFAYRIVNGKACKFLFFRQHEIEAYTRQKLFNKDIDINQILAEDENYQKLEDSDVDIMGFSPFLKRTLEQVSPQELSNKSQTIFLYNNIKYRPKN